jgi:hypothetical protein
LELAGRSGTTFDLGRHVQRPIKNDAHKKAFE